MKKIELIQETDLNGKIWLWIEYNGSKVSQLFFEDQKEHAVKFFNEFRPVTPKKEVLETREV